MYLKIKLIVNEYFSAFKNDSINKLDKLYESKLEQDMYAHRKGDMKPHAMITVKA
jgi:hypothetical protein